VLGAAVSEFDFGAHGRQELASSLNVADLGNVFEDYRFVGQQSRGHGRERGILGAADANCSEQGIAAANYEFVHIDIVRW
jgi:hypothetical protein